MITPATRQITVEMKTRSDNFFPFIPFSLKPPGHMIKISPSLFLVSLFLLKDSNDIALFPLTYSLGRKDQTNERLLCMISRSGQEITK